MSDCACNYVRLRHPHVDESDLLGAGQDGTVWRTLAETAVKVFHVREPTPASWPPIGG